MYRLLKLSKKRLIFLVVFIFCFSYTATSLAVIYFEDEISLPDLWYSAVDFFVPDDISCYNDKKTDNFLVSITDKVFLHNSIFFHETSCHKNLGLRQACSIESAARSHPHRQVNVLFTKPLTEKDCDRGPLSEIYKLPNVDFSRVDLKTYAGNTPLHRVFNKSLTAFGNRHYRRVAEMLKFVTLYRFGGIVVDLDLMLVAPVDFLGNNWVGKEDKEKLGTAIMAASHDKFGRKITLWFLSALKAQAENAEIDGGQAIYAVLNYVCNTSDINEMVPSRCEGFQLYSNEFFYPINHSSWREFFMPGDLNDQIFGYHLWNSENHRYAVPRNSMYARMARKFCPSVFNRPQLKTNAGFRPSSKLSWRAFPAITLCYIFLRIILLYMYD